MSVIVLAGAPYAAAIAAVLTDSDSESFSSAIAATAIFSPCDDYDYTDFSNPITHDYHQPPTGSPPIPPRFRRRPRCRSPTPSPEVLKRISSPHYSFLPYTPTMIYFAWQSILWKTHNNRPFLTYGYGYSTDISQIIFFTSPEAAAQFLTNACYHEALALTTIYLPHPPPNLL